MSQLSQSSKPLSAHLVKRFSDGAKAYHAQATVQQTIATAFAQWLEQQLREPPKTMVEIGCGTGFLTKTLASNWPNATIHATDVSPGMLTVAETYLSELPNVVLFLWDARQPWPELGSNVFPQHVDLTTACMTVHWLGDWAEKVSPWTNHTNAMAFALMGEGSLSSWQTWCQANGLTCKLAHYPNESDIRGALLNDWQVTLTWQTFTETYPSAWAFGQHLRAIGMAGEPTVQATQQNETNGSIGQLRSHHRQHKAGTAQPFIATYNVAFVLAQRSGSFETTATEGH